MCSHSLIGFIKEKIEETDRDIGEIYYDWKNMEKSENLSVLKTIVETAVRNFSENALLSLLNEQKPKLDHYHQILLSLAPQVYNSSSTFSLAAVRTPPQFEKIRLYLMAHADEEKTHYTWVINDLKNTGYSGPHPLKKMPTLSCLNYISLNWYVAEQYPLARLGIAAVLESIGASLGKGTFLKVVEVLKLQPNQVTFFHGHGDTDVGHIADIFKVLAESPLSDDDWKQICYFATMAGEIYKSIYEEVARNVL